MGDFEKNIANFQKNGTFVYIFDEAGNITLNPSSSIFQQNYISFPTVNINYNDSKIDSFYDDTFSEFVSTNQTQTTNISQEIIDQINEVTKRNQLLQNQLNDLISQTEIDSAAADNQAIKDIIIELRIQLKQGSTSADFNDDFPYLPIPVDQRDL